MHPVRAKVERGRLVAKAPDELEEGEEVVLVPLDRDWDDLDDESRAALHASIDRGIADAEAGRVVEAGAVLESLRTRAGR